MCLCEVMVPWRLWSSGPQQDPSSKGPRLPSRLGPFGPKVLAWDGSEASPAAQQTVGCRLQGGP